jgi:DNA invertase Pin-like site-specific DNA recombinase
MLGVFAAVADFERDLIHECRLLGLARAARAGEDLWAAYCALEF